MWCALNIHSYDYEWNILIFFNWQEVSESFHDDYISNDGCNIPFFGGLRISNEKKQPLCINTSLYDFDMIFDMMKTIQNKMKAPCKASETYFGVPTIEHVENATM